MSRVTARHLGIFLLPVMLFGLASKASAQDGSIRIAVVDVQRVVALSTAGQELNARLNTFRKSVEGQLKAESQRLADLGRSVSGAATPQEAQRLQKEYEDAAIKLQRLKDDKEREGQKMQDQGLKEIEQGLIPVFTEVRDAEGYDLILAATPGLTLMISERVDITQKVIDSLNSAE